MNQRSILILLKYMINVNHLMILKDLHDKCQSLYIIMILKDLHDKCQSLYIIMILKDLHDKCQSRNILMILKDNGYIKADTSMSSNSSFFLRLMLDSSSLSSRERSSGTVEKQM